MKTILALALLGASMAAAPAYADPWVLLGQRVVSDRVDHDEIVLPGHARYDHIKFCVTRNPVHIYDVKVHYQNGGVQDVSVRSHIPRGGCTRAIDLNGGERDITRISFTYEASGWGWHTATVRVYGRL